MEFSPKDDTLQNTNLLGLDNEIGTIKVGKKADLIIVDFEKPHLYPHNDICAPTCMQKVQMLKLC